MYVTKLSFYYKTKTVYKQKKLNRKLLDKEIVQVI